jgi:hypothetical protein
MPRLIGFREFPIIGQLCHPDGHVTPILLGIERVYQPLAIAISPSAVDRHQSPLGEPSRDRVRDDATDDQQAIPTARVVRRKRRR